MGPIVRGPICQEPVVTSWAPDSQTPWPNCPPPKVKMIGGKNDYKFEFKEDKDNSEAGNVDEDRSAAVPAKMGDTSSDPSR